MLDPYKLPHPRMFPQTHPAVMTSRGAGKLYPTHVHKAYSDTRTGDGNTSIDASHYHRIKSGVILPDESDGHTHGLTNIPAGAGI